MTVREWLEAYEYQWHHEGDKLSDHAKDYMNNKDDPANYADSICDYIHAAMHSYGVASFCHMMITMLPKTALDAEMD